MLVNGEKLVFYTNFKCVEYLDAGDTSRGQLWIVFASIGGGVALILCGWCVLCVCFNTVMVAFDRDGANPLRKGSISRTSTGGIQILPSPNRLGRITQTKAAEINQHRVIKETECQTDDTNGVRDGSANDRSLTYIAKFGL